MKKYMFLLIISIIFTTGNIYAQNLPTSRFSVQYFGEAVSRYEVIIGSNDGFDRQIIAAKQLLLRSSGLNENLLERTLKLNYGMTSYREQSVPDIDGFLYYNTYTKIIAYMNMTIISVYIIQYTPLNNNNQRRYNISERAYEW